MEHIRLIDFSLNLYVYIILKIYRKIKLFTEKFFCGFPRILAEPHNHKEVISLSYRFGGRDWIRTSGTLVEFAPLAGEWIQPISPTRP